MVGTRCNIECMRESVRCCMLVEVELSAMPQTAVQVLHSVSEFRS